MFEFPSGSVFGPYFVLFSDKGSFDGYRLHWRTPAVMTPLALQSEFRSQYISIGVDGELLDEQASVDRGYSLTASEDTIDSSIPIAAEGAIRKVWSVKFYHV